MHKEERQPIGEILQRLGYINQSQLTEALEFQNRLPPGMHQPLGEILIDFGYITQEQLDNALNAQEPFRRVPLGEILIQKGIINESQLSLALRVQHSLPKDQYKKLGYILVELEYATKQDIKDALDVQAYDE